VWLTAVGVYFLAIFHRSSLGVAGLAAAERFDISASQLSTFTVLQLLVYAGMQIPVGVLIDRYGPQRLLFTGAVLMTCAQLGFALTTSYGGAVAARVFVGMGDAMVFISVLRLIASWFPPMRSPVLTAWTALLGQCGALVAAIPLARSLEQFGWTPTFAASAAVGVVLGLLVLVLVRDVPPGAPPSRTAKDVRTVGRDLRLSWRDPGTRLGLWSHFTAQFGANVLGLLWGYPFFVHGQHTGTAAAGLLLSLLVVTFMVGGPLVGGSVASLLMMLAIGVLLDVLTPGSGTDYPARAYTLAMSVQYVGWVLGVVLIWRYRRRARAHLERTQPETFRDMTGR
jgi:MFS family permease